MGKPHLLNGWWSDLVSYVKKAYEYVVSIVKKVIDEVIPKITKFLLSGQAHFVNSKW